MCRLHVSEYLYQIGAFPGDNLFFNDRKTHPITWELRVYTSGESGGNALLRAL